MRNQFNQYILSSLFIVCFISLQAQDAPGYPVIGKKCPAFLLKNAEGHFKKDASSKDFLGKPFIIDFFSRGCTGCFVSFPKMNSFRLKYANQVNFLLVGQVSNQHSYYLTKESYDVFKLRYDLKLPVVYDSLIGPKFKVEGVPHIIWVDKSGIVRAVTNEVDEEKLKKFIAGEPFAFTDNSYDGRKLRAMSFDWNTPFLVNSNGGPDSAFIQRSMLSEWREGMPAGMWFNSVTAFQKEKMPVQFMNITATNLLTAAYFDKASDWFPTDSLRYANYHYSPIIETSDTNIFKDDKRYCYSLVLPEHRLRDATIIMQNDMENFFGVDISVETRKMPYLRLVATDAAKKSIITKGGTAVRNHSFASSEYINIPVSRVVDDIMYDAYLVSKDLPLLNETGYSGNVDLKFEAVMTDWKDIQKGLQKIGLDLVIGEKEMKCIVVRNRR